MMTLPKFICPNPSTAELWEEQSRLKVQAQKMIDQTQILSVFSKYGELSEIGGSYKYDLMVYPDLDIGIISRSVSKKDFAHLVSELTSNQYVRKVGTADGINFEAVHPGRPKGYWIGLEIPFEEDRWGIDCWVQQPDWVAYPTDIYGERLRLLDQSGKDAILKIKYDLIRSGIYGKTVFLGDVYDAVLDKGIRSLQEFGNLSI